MAAKKLRPVHPGDILRNDFLEPLGLTAYRLAKQLGVSRPTITQIEALSQVVRGYFAYHAVPTNSRSLSAFRFHVTELWRRALRRRSQRDRSTWNRMTELEAAFLPLPRILHPWPTERFAANNPRWKPDA